MITFEKFLVSPIKVRTLFTKKLLNKLNYGPLPETFIEDKLYKKALKKYQLDNNFGGNCVVSKDVFQSFVNYIPDINDIWNEMRCNK